MDPLTNKIKPTNELLQHFVSQHIAEPDEADRAELSHLLGKTKSTANRAFLQSLTAEGVPDPGDSVDMQEALSLISKSKRPRVRGILRLTAARLAAQEAKEKSSAGGMSQADNDKLAAALAELNEAKAAMEAAGYDVAALEASGGEPSIVDVTDVTDVPKRSLANAPSRSLPAKDASVLFVALPGTLPAAHEVASLISDHASGLSPLPSPCDGGGAAYPWLVKTRYFSASVWLVVAPLTESNGPALSELASGCGAVVFFFSDEASSADGSAGAEAGAGWARLTAAVEASFSAVSNESDICIVMGVNGEATKGGKGGGGQSEAQREQIASKRIEWCLDKGVELVQADISYGSAEVEAASSAAKGGGFFTKREEDPEGLPRLVEALTCRMWPPLEDAASAEAAVEAHAAAAREYAASIGTEYKPAPPQVAKPRVAAKAKAAATADGAAGGAASGEIASDAERLNAAISQLKSTAAEAAQAASGDAGGPPLHSLLDEKKPKPPPATDDACPSCGLTGHTSDARFCRGCGTARPVACPGCGLTGHASDARFCRGCGSQLAKPPAPPPPQQPPPTRIAFDEPTVAAPAGKVRKAAKYTSGTEAANVVRVTETDEEVSDRLLKLAGAESPGAAGADEGLVDEKEQEAMDRLIKQMSFLRESGETLSHEARRERAAAAATEMAKLFGDDDYDGEDSDDGDQPQKVKKGGDGKLV